MIENPLGNRDGPVHFSHRALLDRDNNRPNSIIREIAAEPYHPMAAHLRTGREGLSNHQDIYLLVHFRILVRIAPGANCFAERRGPKIGS